MFLVRVAVLDLIVVLSSTASKALLWNKNLCAMSLPLLLERASTFIRNICRSSQSGLNKVFISVSFFFVFSGDHTTMLDLMWSGKWVGISLRSQFLYTPFGAIIKAESISPLSYSMAILSINTFDLPVPISIKKA